MSYTTPCYGEAQAASGLTGTAALTGSDHSVSGDKVHLFSHDMPFLLGGGGLSDTKPQQAALVPDNQNAGAPRYLPAGMNFSADGWAKWMRKCPVPLQKSDKLTGQISNTNVNEGSIVAFDIVYGMQNVPKPWTLDEVRSRYEDIITDICTITSAAAVTFNSGGGALSDGRMTNYSKWIDPDAWYEILGVQHGIGAATFGGVANVSKLAGKWAGKFPGLIINPLSAVTFDAGESFIPALEPIPFKGDSPPDIGMTATSAGAVTFVLVIGKLKAGTKPASV